MCSVKDSSIYYEDSKIKAIVKELAGFAGKIREGNELFNFMRQIHENWNRKIKYSAAGKLAPYDLDIMADCRFVVPNDSVDSFNRQQQQLKHKTAVIIPPKLT